MGDHCKRQKENVQQRRRTVDENIRLSYCLCDDGSFVTEVKTSANDSNRNNDSLRGSDIYLSCTHLPIQSEIAVSDFYRAGS